MSKEPLFWYSPRSDGGYAGPLHSGQIEDVRKASGAWVPLFAGAAPVSAEPVAVSQCPFPCGWSGLHKIAVQDAAYLAKVQWPEDEEGVNVPRATAMRSMDYLIQVCRTMLNAAPVTAQPDLTQQTLDDVKAGIPARDAEIEALRKEIETLQRAQARPTFDDLQALAIKHGAWVPGYGPFAAELLATYGLAPEKQPHWVTGWLNAMNAVNAKAAQQPVSGASQGTEANNRRKALLENQGKGEVPSWTGHGDADAALIMLDRLDVSGGDNDRVDEISAIIRKLAAKQNQFRDAAQMIEPSGNSGELPELTIQWHDTPEAVHRIFWEKTAIENGLTYEELIEGAMVGETEERQKVDLTYEQEIQAIRDQKCWGCADTDTNQIHVWAAPDVDRALLIHMLAHEIGHLTGEPHPDDIQEELRAETFGKVAALAYHMLPSSQGTHQVNALPSLNDDLIAILGRPNFLCAQLADILRSGGQEIAKRAENEQAAVIHFLLGHYLADPAQWAEKANAAIDAARKEQA
ncbi:hypothetical protein [Alcaligenes faecalis]|uniref:Uncharacterized protein n=2 Tax=Alcaligenes faecalis TaxID=511 RepID=A0A2U2BG89_ALCFA|nr:hypothetical protein [Alcaligenes faecalis]PWE13034.1 hypothetical protein DF183_14455 [Alcaligenes faecalis]